MVSHRWITIGELKRRRDEWHDLVCRSGFSSPYGDPGWVLAWWRTYGSELTPWCIALEDDIGRLQGLALLALETKGLVRTLRFMGSPWNGIDSLVYAAGVEEELTDRTLSSLAASSGGWDLWRIQRLPMESRLSDRLLRGGGQLSATAHDVRLQPYITLPDDQDTFEARFSGKHRRRHRQRWRRMVDAGLSLRLIADPDDATAVVGALVQMQRERANSLRRSRSHLDSRFERFATAAVRDLFPDSVRLWALQTADGEHVAICLDLVARDREHGYMIGIGNRYREFSPGTFLKQHVVAAAISERRREFDLGPGRDASKYVLGAIDRELTRVVVGSPSWRGRAASMLAGLDLRARDTALAERLRARRGVTPERARAQPTANS